MNVSGTPQLLQLRVLRLGCFQDGNVGVGVLLREVYAAQQFGVARIGTKRVVLGTPNVPIRAAGIIFQKVIQLAKGLVFPSQHRVVKRRTPSQTPTR